MTILHTVTQGEHLSRIAKRYGFSDYRTIWDHPKNAELKQKRQNPNVLFPGDHLVIPDKEQKTEARPTDQRHRFLVKTQKLKLRIVVEDMYEKPIANAPFELHVEGEVHQLTSDGRGRIEQDIPSTAERAGLIVKSRETPLDGALIPVKIGHLDPVNEVPGQKGRLMNLGYYFGAIDGKEDLEFRSAVEEFQCDHPPLVVDGKCGARTQEQLKVVHGC